MLFIALAGFAGGAVNAAAGGGTLVTFPALIAAGIHPLAANITSSIGLLSGYLGGSVAYRAELVAQKDRLKSFLVVSLVGGALGAAVLLTTPATVFEEIVPFLVIGSGMVLAAQPWLANRLRRVRERGAPAQADDDVPRASWGAYAGVFAASIYGSYFGAGLGVLLLAVLGIFVHDSLQRLNALKGLLSLFVNAIGVLIFLFSGLVNWMAVLVLVPAAYAGGTVGARFARKLPPLALRYTVVALAIVVGVVMLVR